jgi:hypothetical protein
MCTGKCVHHKAFRAVYILRTAKILRTQRRCSNSSTAQILMQVRQ